jgi:hypothetical protein
MVTAVQPRADLRGATLRAAARLSQLPPAGEAAQRPAAGLVVTGSAAAAPDSPGETAPAAGRPASPPGAARRSGQSLRRRLSGPLPRLALALSCVLAAVVVVLALMMHGTQHRLDQAQLRSHAIASVLTAADVTMMSRQVSTGGTATVVMSRERRALVFTAQGLPQPGAGQRYELWLMGPAGIRSAGMLAGAPGGMVGPVVVHGLTAGDRVGMTMEPAAGAAKPGSAMVVVLGVGGG